MTTFPATITNMTSSAAIQPQHNDYHAVKNLAFVYKAAGDPMRLEILHILGEDTYGVLELATIFSLQQSAMSHHLKVLASAGLVETQREGNSIFYRRPLLTRDNPLDSAKAQLFTVLDENPVSASIAEQIKTVSGLRADQSQAFFAKNADQFKKQQELIAGFALYADPLADLLGRKVQQQRDTALEIGPGEGGFLPVLSKLFNKVTAVDNSQSMLAKARQAAGANQLNNVEFIFGTTTDVIKQKHPFNVIVMNMVLHHVPSPASLIQDCATLLCSGGMLFISELNKHHQTWVRENCGDVWLGFDANELSQWAGAASLDEGENIFIGIRNGFQIQLRQFIKA